MDKKKRLFFLFLLFLLMQGCAGRGLKEEARSHYFAIFDRWTKSVKVYDELDTKIYVSATYRTKEFRKAYVDEYARRYLLANELKGRLLEKEIEEGERVNEFFLSLFTPELSWNDLDKDDSIWKLYLEDDKGNRVVPIFISRVKEDNPVIREFYPSLDLWSYGYIVRFPRFSQEGLLIPGPETKFLRLIITGAPGRAELEWTLSN